MKPLGRRSGLAALGSGVFGLSLVFAGAVSATADDETPGDLAIERVAGDNRYETAANIAELHYNDGANTVYIARGDDYPDALAGGPSASVGDAPILLVKKGQIPGATQAALTSLNPNKIVVLGGKAAVNAAVFGELNSLTGASVERVSGEDRYATAVAASKKNFKTGEVDTVYIATGGEASDALAAGAVAGAESAPILLVKTDDIPAVVGEELDRLHPKNIVVLGGSNAVNQTVFNALKGSAPGANVSRVSGEDRYATSAALANHQFQGSDTVYLATGAEFADALAGGPSAVLDGAPILVIKKNGVPKVTQTALEKLEPEKVTILGGTSAVSKSVEDQLEKLFEVDEGPADGDGGEGK